MQFESSSTSLDNIFEGFGAGVITLDSERKVHLYVFAGSAAPLCYKYQYLIPTHFCTVREAGGKHLAVDQKTDPQLDLYLLRLSPKNVDRHSVRR